MPHLCLPQRPEPKLLQVRLCMCVYACAFACMHVRLRVRVCLCVYACAFVCAFPERYLELLVWSSFVLAIVSCYIINLIFALRPLFRTFTVDRLLLVGPSVLLHLVEHLQHLGKLSL